MLEKYYEPNFVKNHLKKVLLQNIIVYLAKKDIFLQVIAIK